MGVLLPILELPEKPSDDDLVICGFLALSAMLFPLEEEAKERRHFQAASMVMGAYRQFQARGETDQPFIYHEWISDLWELPQAPQRVWLDGNARAYRARLSGQLLGFLLRLARHHPEHYRVERAKALVQETFGPDAPSISLLDKTWASFKSVSPFWLSFEELPEGTFSSPETEVVDWLRVLARAEACRRSAESMRILKASETWRVRRVSPCLAWQSSSGRSLMSS